MDDEGVVGFFGEAEAVVADAEPQLFGVALQLLDVALASLGEAVQGGQNPHGVGAVDAADIGAGRGVQSISFMGSGSALEVVGGEAELGHHLGVGDGLAGMCGEPSLGLGDKTPSLVITPAKNLWHCMGACNAGGTAIDWVMRAEGISFRHAVELLRKDEVPLAASPIQPVKKSTVPKLPAPLKVEAKDRELLLEVVGFYQAALTGSPEAMRYLEGRGLQSAEMVERFRLGFANRTLGYGLEAKNRAGGAAVRGRLQRLGIYRESGQEHLNGSLVVPVINPAGDVLEMYGRKITPNLREGMPNHLYLPGEHRGVWNGCRTIALIRSYPPLEFGRIALHPAEQCGWTDRNAALLHHLRQISVANSVFELPADTQQDDLDRETASLEREPS